MANLGSYELIGKYHVLGQVAAGGMGIIYRAVDPTLDRPVAIKAMRPEFVSERKLVDRFRNEAMALARLTHPNIAVLYDYFEEAGTHFMVMEYIDGLNLSDIIEENGAIPLNQVSAVFGPVLQALAYAHDSGVVHRDIKPSNIMITRHGVVKLTDFGIARLKDSSKLTRTGQGLGSLPYMAPEQIKIDSNNPPDARADLYALSITMFEALTDRMPFDAETEFAWMQAHLESDPPNPCEKRDQIPTALGLLVQQGMAKSRDDRPASAQQYLDLMRAACQDQETAVPKKWFEALPVPSFDATIVPRSPSAREHTADNLTRDSDVAPRRKWLIPTIAAAAVVIAVGGWFLTRSQQPATPMSSEPAQTAEQPSDTATSTPSSSQEDLAATGGGTQTRSEEPPASQAGAAPNLVLKLSPDWARAGADVWIDGRQQPQGTVEFSGITPGIHEVVVRAKSVSAARQIDIPFKGARDAAFDFSRPPGDLRVGFNTTDGSLLYLATLYVDGQKWPKEAPATLKDLASESHKIELRADGYTAEGGAKYVRIEPSQTAEVFFHLQPSE